MLGSVSAFRGNEHLRMTAIVGMLTPHRRAVLDVVAVGAAFAFLAFTLHPAIEFTRDEVFITMPTLGISNAWRTAALPIGLALMLVFSVLRLASAGSMRVLAATLGGLALIVALFWLGAPIFRQLGNYNLLIFFVGGVAACVLAGVPIAFAFGLATVGYLGLATTTPMMVLIGRMDEGMSHLILLAVPLFVFLGLLIEMTGMAKAMVAFLASLLGHVRGGLHYVLVAGMYLVSGISGLKRLTWQRCTVLCGLGRDHSAQSGADRDRLRHRRVDRGAVHRGLAAWRGAGNFAMFCGRLALPARRHRRCPARAPAYCRPHAGHRPAIHCASLLDSRCGG
jgi:hypothetical protein